MRSRLHWLTYAVVAAAAFAGGAAVWSWTRPAPYDPLGPYPVQIVAEPRVKVDTTQLNVGEATALLPAVTVTDDGNWPDVRVEGVKCADESVEVEGAVVWRRQDPIGWSSPAVISRAPREQGCVSFRFSNPIPDSVRDQVRRAAAAGQPATVWSINGTERPIVVDDRDVVDESWRTENMAILYRPER